MKNIPILKYTLLLGLIFFCLNTSIAQKQLTKAEAVKILLENNYGIKVAQNNRLIAENNTSREANGYLPTVDASAGANSNLGGSTQSFSSGMEAKVSNAFTWGANASVGANYTLYNKQRDERVAQLKELVNLSDFEIRQAIEINMIQLFQVYYDIARQAQNLNVLRETIELDKQRLKRAEYRYEYGQGLKLDILNAEVDIQRDSINYLLAQQQLTNSKRDLSFIIGQEVNTDFDVDTLVSYAPGMTLEQLLSDAENKNIDITLADKNIAISTMDLGVIDAGRKPIVGANATYSANYSKNASEAFITSSNSRGFALGVNVAWNIFDGGARKVQKQNTQVSIQNQQVLRRQTVESLRRDVINAWDSYQNALLVLEVERNSLAINKLNFERTQELFQSAQVSSVEFRQAQLNLLNAETSVNTAKFDAKAIEIQLLQLSGRIMDEEF